MSEVWLCTSKGIWPRFVWADRSVRRAKVRLPFDLHIVIPRSAILVTGRHGAMAGVPPIPRSGRSCPQIVHSHLASATLERAAQQSPVCGAVDNYHPVEIESQNVAADRLLTSHRGAWARGLVPKRRSEGCPPVRRR